MFYNDNVLDVRKKKKSLVVIPSFASFSCVCLSDEISLTGKETVEFEMAQDASTPYMPTHG